MQTWYQEPHFQSLMQVEREQLDRILSHILGEHLVQLGGPCEFSLVSPIRHKVYITKTNTQPLIFNQDTIEGDTALLPILPGSIDVILAIHVLEFMPNPQEFLEEIFQALAPSGQLILLCFNPLSLWGLSHLWKDRHHEPWQGSFHTNWQVKHWLRHQGFRIVNSETFHFRPPIKKAHWERRLLWLEAVGELCIPGMGGVFLISAQKRVEGMTPLKVDWQNRRIATARARACVEPTPRVKHDS